MKTTSLGMRAITLDGEPLITSYQDVEFAFRSPALDNGQWLDGHRVPAGQGAYNGILLGETLAALDGEDHFGRRRIEADLFRSPVLVRYEETRIATATRRTVDRVRAACIEGAPASADLLRLTRVLLTSITAAIVGLDGVDDPEQTERFVTLMDQVAEGATAVYFPDRSETATLGVTAVKAITDEYLRPALERRRQTDRNTGDQRSAAAVDLLTLFVAHEEHFARWDPELLLREVGLFIRGSAHTTTNGLSHTVAELDTWLADHPSEQPRLDDVAFLGTAFEEALRLHPSTPTQWLVANEAVTFPTGLSVSAGQMVAVSFVDANRDARVFGPNADVFDPQREVPDGIRHYGVAFGGGAHSCIGRPLVLGDGRSGDGGRLGTARYILRELYTHGMRPDPTIKPEPHRDFIGHYATFPVIFDRL